MEKKLSEKKGKIFIFFLNSKVEYERPDKIYNIVHMI